VIGVSLFSAGMATTTPCRGFSFAVSGMIIPEAVLSSAGAGLITTLSPKGLMVIFFMVSII